MTDKTNVAEKNMPHKKHCCKGDVLYTDEKGFDAPKDNTCYPMVALGNVKVVAEAIAEANKNNEPLHVIIDDMPVEITLDGEQIQVNLDTGDKCEKPLYSVLCNVDELAKAIAEATGGSTEVTLTVGNDCRKPLYSSICNVDDLSKAIADATSNVTGNVIVESSCEKPLFNKLCNVSELAKAISDKVYSDCKQWQTFKAYRTKGNENMLWAGDDIAGDIDEYKKLQQLFLTDSETICEGGLFTGVQSKCAELTSTNFSYNTRADFPYIYIRAWVQTDEAYKLIMQEGMGYQILINNKIVNSAPLGEHGGHTFTMPKGCYLFEFKGGYKDMTKPFKAVKADGETAQNTLFGKVYTSEPTTECLQVKVCQDTMQMFNLLTGDEIKPDELELCKCEKLAEKSCVPKLHEKLFWAWDSGSITDWLESGEKQWFKIEADTINPIVIETDYTIESNSSHLKSSWYGEVIKALNTIKGVTVTLVKDTLDTTNDRPIWKITYVGCEDLVVTVSKGDSYEHANKPNGDMSDNILTFMFDGEGNTSTDFSWTGGTDPFDV